MFPKMTDNHWVVVSPPIFEQLKELAQFEEGKRPADDTTPTLWGRYGDIRIYVDPNLPDETVLTSASLGSNKTPLLRLVEGVYGGPDLPHPLA